MTTTEAAQNYETERAKIQKFNAIIALERKYLPRGARNVELDIALKSMDHAEYQEFLAYRSTAKS